jgi:diguanylate cyclase (GGDEF)-like protein
LRISGGIFPFLEIPFASYACHASVASFTLLAWGFRQRADKPARFVFLFWALTTIFLVAVYEFDWSEWRMASRMATAIADAVMVAVIVMTLKPRNRAAETVRWLLALYGSYVFAVAIVAWLARPGGEISGPLFIVFLSIGTPTGMIGTGILTMLIVAADLARDLKQQAMRDPLTGLYNRRGLEEQLQASAGAYAVVAADLDHFKAINDRLGHAAGDEVIAGFARHLAQNLRKTDVAARIGGEEFVLVLPQTTQEEASAMVERIRLGVPAALAPAVDVTTGVTASFGLTLRRGNEAFATTLARADAALNRSKDAGRNRLSVEA